MIGDVFENLGELTPDEAARLLRQWADQHEWENYHEWVTPLCALAERVESITAPIQCFVTRSEYLFAKSVAEFYINPNKEV